MLHLVYKLEQYYAIKNYIDYVYRSIVPSYPIYFCNGIMEFLLHTVKCNQLWRSYTGIVLRASKIDEAGRNIAYQIVNGVL